MKLKLIDRGTDLIEAWSQHFGAATDVTIIQGDICEVECDAVVSPANSFGFMDGGVDYALSERFGWNLQDELQRVIREKHDGELPIGQAEIIPTGDANIPWLISAPTMRVPRHIKTTVNAFLAMRAILKAVRDHIESPTIEVVAMTGLGTGVGALPADISALQMWTAYDRIVLGSTWFPEDFGRAQEDHLRLNRNGMIYD